MESHIIVTLLIFMIICSTDGEQVLKSNDKNPKQGQSFGNNLVDPYYKFNPDFMGGNMPNIPLYPTNPGVAIPSTCTCSCGDTSFGPPVTCLSPQTCVGYCLQMYPDKCTLVNTYGCCGGFCRYFQTQSLETRYCTCNCGGQQFLNPINACASSQSCLTQCLTNFPLACRPTTTQACCGQDCQSYSQAVMDSCACQCQGMTYYPAPKCSSAQGCVSVCMTTYGSCTAEQTQGCCGASCSNYVPTCTCNCGPDFTITTSVPCQSGRTCVETCLASYSACTQDNTQGCCGVDCLNSFPTCTCMCGANQYTTLAMSCGSPQQCVQACLQSVAQCNVGNTQGCCGSECIGYIPTCRCLCGSSIYYSTFSCATAEQCTNACISQFGFICTSTNTLGCCNGTYCTRQNRFLGVNKASKSHMTDVFLFLSMSYFYKFI